MTSFEDWIKKWAVPDEAIRELDTLLNPSCAKKYAQNATKEADVLNNLRLKYSERGWVMWRNNVGATVDKNGRHIRYGLANESKRMNSIIKSSDLIGIRPVKITQKMVGETIGQFVAREVKSSDWQFKGTSRELSQRKFLLLIKKMGGDAKFTNGSEEN